MGGIQGTDRIRAVVFDAVGTLIDPEPTVAVAYAAAASRQGVSLRIETVAVRFRRAFQSVEPDTTRGPLGTDEAAEERRWRVIVETVLPEVPDLGRAFDELWIHFARPDSWRCFEDVAPTLEHFARIGIEVRIGSNFDARLRTVLRGLSPLASLADSAIISSEVGYRKPHPDFFRASCSCLGRPPGEILFVGDDPENDLVGPQVSGLSALLLDRSGRYRATHEGVEDLRGLVALFPG